MIKFVDLVTRLKSIDYSRVAPRKRDEFIRNEAKLSGANEAESEVILSNVLGK